MEEYTGLYVTAYFLPYIVVLPDAKVREKKMDQQQLFTLWKLKMKTEKINKIYLALAFVIIGYCTYSCWYGKAFWQSKVERNTEYEQNRSSIYRNRVYHK